MGVIWYDLVWATGFPKEILYNIMRAQMVYLESGQHLATATHITKAYKNTAHSKYCVKNIAAIFPGLNPVVLASLMRIAKNR